MLTRRTLLAAAATATATATAVPFIRPARAALPDRLATAEGMVDAQVASEADCSGGIIHNCGRARITAQQPGRAGMHVFDIAFIETRRVEKIEGVGWRLYQHEVGLYLDKDGGAVLRNWQNPFTGQTVSPLPVDNIIVAPSWRYDTIAGMGADDLGDDIALWRESWLRYPSPIDFEAYPRFTQGPFLQVGALYTNMIARAAVAAGDPNPPMQGTWTLLQSWLPWMEMGSRPGRLVYRGTRRKLRDWRTAFSDEINRVFERELAAGLTPPTDPTPRFQSSWDIFKRERGIE